MIIQHPMAASVNNIAAAFSASRPPPALSSSPSPSAKASFSSSSSTAGGGLAISASWNPHSALRRSHCSSLLSLYGPPGPPPPSHLLLPPPPKQLLRTTIVAGSRLPCATLSYLSNGAVRTVSANELSRGRKAVMLGVPAAFAPRRWWSGKLTAEELVRRAGEIRERGAVVVACISVNDVFVMRAWGESIGALAPAEGRGGVMMLSDPDAGMAAAMGLAADFTGGAEGFGLRSETYCVVAADGIVKAVFRDGNGVGFDDVIRAI